MKEKKKEEKKERKNIFLAFVFCVPDLKAERWINITADQISKSNSCQTIDDFVISLLLMSFTFPQRQSSHNDVFLLSRINVHILVLDTGTS